MKRSAAREEAFKVLYSLEIQKENLDEQLEMYFENEEISEDEIKSYIKDTVKENMGVDIPVLYGGSVKPLNSTEILAMDSVDGVLIGGASLKAEDYVKIAESRG